MHALRSLAMTLLLLASTGAAQAADTLETWDEGAVDLELSGGVDGLGPAIDERAPFGAALVGVGALDRFSLWAGLGLQADATLGEPRVHPALGAFGTPLDGNHADVDLGVELVLADDDGHFRAKLFAELNLDFDADRSSAGFYARAGVVVHGFGLRDRASTHAAAEGAALELEPGLYAALAEGHELLAEVDMAVHAAGASDGHSFEVGAVHLGYNALVDEALEIVSEASFDVPQGDERWAFGCSLGLIATIEPSDGTGAFARTVD